MLKRKEPISLHHNSAADGEVIGTINFEHKGKNSIVDSYLKRSTVEFDRATYFEHGGYSIAKVKFLQRFAAKQCRST
jgi:uncharacterized protein YkuJ